MSQYCFTYFFMSHTELVLNGLLDTSLICIYLNNELLCLSQNPTNVFLFLSTSILISRVFLMYRLVLEKKIIAISTMEYRLQNSKQFRNVCLILRLKGLKSFCFLTVQMYTLHGLAGERYVLCLIFFSLYLMCF